MKRAGTSARLGFAVAVLVGLTSSGVRPALAQDISSVVVRPLDPRPEAPNAGAWFVYDAGPGQELRGRAFVGNPADVPQQVTLEIRDLVFEDGEGRLRQSEDLDIGRWASFVEPVVDVPARSSHIADFVIRVPDDVEPGDHLGAVVARTSNLQGGVEVTRQIATRIYVTVPGEAERSFLIEEIDVGYDFWLWPSEALVTVHLHNDGRVRLRPEVTVDDVTAGGSELLLSRSTEQYAASFDIPWYGTILRLPVSAVADGGLTRTASTTRIVFPLGLFILLVVAGSATYAGRRWWVNRKSATAELKQDIQRLERLITEQAKTQETTAGTAVGLPAGDVPEDEDAILLAALKRARRSNDDTALARIALAKHVTSGDALDLVLEALEQHDGKHRDALLDAAVSYGADALSTHERFGDLSDGTQAELGERLVTAGGTVSGNGNGEPAKVRQPAVGQTDSDVLRAALAEVKGVGPAKQEALVARFGSVDAIRAADVEDLVEIPGVGYATAREILDRLDA